MEVGQAIFALHFVDPKLDLSKRMILVFLQISQRDLKYPSLQSVVRILETSGPVDKCFPNTASLSYQFGGSARIVRTRELGRSMVPGER